MSKRRKILFLAHLFPLPMDSGGKIKSYYTLKTLSEHHEVSVISYIRNEEELSRLRELGSLCDRISTVPLQRSKMRQVSDAARSMLLGKSFIVSRDYRAEMQSIIDSEIEKFKPHIVHIDHLQMAQFVKFGNYYRTVLDHHNVESMIVKRVGESPGKLPVRLYSRIEWPKLQHYELNVCRQADMVITVSEEDKSILMGLRSDLANIEAVPIGVDVDFFGSAQREMTANEILSVATMYWPPNVDSMHYFCSDILPLIWERKPDATINIAGQKPVSSIIELGVDPRIRVTGYVSDSRELAKNCGVFVVPLRSGSGVRVKILNAMAMGLPIVSTSIGAEGLDVVSGEHLIIADTPADFAEAVLNVLSDADMAENLGKSARELVREKYSWQTVGQKLLSAYEKLP